MKIVTAELVPASGGRYEEIVKTLRSNPEQWFEVGPGEVKGDTVRIRRRALYSAAAYRKVKITTRLSGDTIYVRLVSKQDTSNV